MNEYIVTWEDRDNEVVNEMVVEGIKRAREIAARWATKLRVGDRIRIGEME